MNALMATLIMYYEESEHAGEVNMVTNRMRNAMTQSKLATNPMDAHHKLCKWGCLVKAHFDEANLHLTSRSASSGHEQIVGVVQQLANSMASFQRAMHAEVQTLSNQMSTMSSDIVALSGRVCALGDMLSTRAMRSPAASSLGKRAAQADHDEGAHVGAANAISANPTVLVELVME